MLQIAAVSVVLVSPIVMAEEYSAAPVEAITPPVVVGSPSPSLAGSLPNVPPAFDEVAPYVHRLVGVVQSLIDTQAELKRLRTEEDELKTKLSTIESELSLVDQEHRQHSAHVAAAEKGQQERLGALRRELEHKLTTELAAMRAQIAQDTQHDFNRELEAFQARQEELVGKTLDHELALKERELQQLSEEINVQTQELLERLSRLDANPELAKQLERTTTQALAKRKADLDARRAQLATQRRELITRQRNAFVQKLTQQREADSQRRLTFKEASLRSAMAELLRKSEAEEREKVARARETAERVQQRHNKLVQQQALLRARMEEMGSSLAAKHQSRERLEAERLSSAGDLEQALAKTGQNTVHPEALAWLGRTIRYLPSAVAAELIPMQQRLVAAAEEEERLREQRRIVRERQQALQLSREMTEQHRRNQERQRRELEVRSRNAEELLVKADKLASRGQFDQALELMAQAQAINPPQLDRIAMLREQLLVTKAHHERAAQSAELDALFQQARTAFDAGRYEEAVVLFEQVIAQEASLGQPTSPAASRPRSGRVPGAMQ
jgi:hypothetical protein